MRDTRFKIQDSACKMGAINAMNAIDAGWEALGFRIQDSGCKMGAIGAMNAIDAMPDARYRIRAGEGFRL